MPRLPIDLMQSGIREDLPKATPAVATATSDSFGGQVGQALQGLGQAGLQLAAAVRKHAEKEEKFDATKGLIATQDADSIAFEESKRDISGNGAGFWQAQRDATRKRMDDYLGTLPEGLRKEFAVDAERIVAARTKQAFTAQYEQSDANTRLTLDEEARKAGLQVNEDPKAYETAVAQAEKLIDASPLTPLEKTQKKQALRNSLAYTAEQAEAQKNPAGVVAAGVGGGLRDKIRGKESSGNDTAQNPTSTARGRYQFLDTTWNGYAGAAGVPAVTAENRGTANDPRNSGAAQEKVMDQYIAASTAALSSAQLPITDANLYLLHFMGQAGGVKFLRALNVDASGTAAAAFPKEAAANKSVFYGGKDKVALSLSEVYNKLTSGLNGTGTTPSSVSPARAALTADQTRAVDESARRAMIAQAAQAAAAATADQNAQRDATYVQIKEGPNPNATYEAARKSGLISSYDQITKAEGIIKAREAADNDLQIGIELMGAGRNGANPYDKAHKDGIDAFYNAGVKAGRDPAAMAAAVFDRTGLVPPTYATSLRGALVSDDPKRAGAAVMTASNMLSQNPNALAGVEGKDQIEAAATEYQRLTGPLAMSSEDAVKRIQADARTPKDTLKDEVLQQFKKDYLTVDKLDSRMQSKLGVIFGIGASVPQGPQRSAIGNIYSELAQEGMRQFQNADRALDWADFKMKQQFGTQNGVITRYPPEKATAIPEIEGKGKSWVNEQAADVVKEQLGIVVDPKQISFVPITGRDGANTAQAFNNGGVDVNRSVVKPGVSSSFRSVPYQIVVVPTPDQIKEGASIQTLNGAFFPDAEGYVTKSNAARLKAAAEKGDAPVTMYDANGVPYTAPAHAPELLQTPDQVERRKKAETEAALAKGQRTQRALNAMPPLSLGEVN